MARGKNGGGGGGGGEEYGRVLYKHLPDYSGASKSQIQASILKDQEITVARIGQAKSVL